MCIYEWLETNTYDFGKQLKNTANFSQRFIIWRLAAIESTALATTEDALIKQFKSCFIHKSILVFKDLAYPLITKDQMFFIFEAIIIICYKIVSETG